MAIKIKSPEEIEKLRKSNLIVAETHAKLKEMVAPGITTMDLERVAEEEARRNSVRPAFKGYRGYPWCLCTSINDQVVHGMPSMRRLEEGDILSIDFGVECDGFYGDSAITVPVGEVSAEATRLLDVTRVSLDKAIEVMLPGNTIASISSAVEDYVESEGFTIVRAFVGHGIGEELHEPPQVPNFLMPGVDITLKAGMVLAIEPMVNAGGYEVKVLDDGWTAVTVDGSLSAHYEHSVAITDDGPYVLSRL